jgi:tRNA modification GTPase
LRLRGLEFPAWIYHFRAAHSYSGDETIEFHIPGNPLLARMLLDELIKLGARQAEPGEFTARAFFNGRLDLSQAEGVAAMIAAASDSELRAARQLMAGELARRVQPAMDRLTDTLALVEVGIDFSEEDVAFLSSAQILSRLEAIDQILRQLLRESVRIERLAHTPQFVLVGRPNAGKSTLLNALVGEHRAVVSPQAGTTRDALSVDVDLPRGVVRLIDIAGIESIDADSAQTAQEISRQMQQRARAMIEAADRVILIQDITDVSPPLDFGELSRAAISRPFDAIVFTKADLIAPETASKELLVSAKRGDGMSELRRRLDELAFGTSGANTLALNARHIEAIHQSREALGRAKDHAADGPEIIAVELREALDALGGILGQVTPDDVLGRIFSSFCIGK